MIGGLIYHGFLLVYEDDFSNRQETPSQMLAHGACEVPHEVVPHIMTSFATS